MTDKLMLGEEMQRCCDRIMNTVNVIREENDSTRKKNVSLRKIIKNLRHSNSPEGNMVETKNQLLEEKVWFIICFCMFFYFLSFTSCFFGRSSWQYCISFSLNLRQSSS